MSDRNFKNFLIFFSTAIAACLVIALNYFQTEIVSFWPQLPPYTITVFSIDFVLVTFYGYWREQAESDRARDEFISVITHKFRTPLTGVKWAIEMLRTNLTEQQKQDVLRQMEDSNERLMEIVDLTVGFAKFDKHLEYAYEAGSLREFVDFSLQKYSDKVRAKNINFTLNSDSALPLVIIDKRKIQFVIDMLIDNAIKYTPAGGVITISFEQKGSYLILSIHDTGIGISWADKRNVFKKFYRSHNAKITDTEGMGLGLYAAKSIIDKHRGRIWFDSKGVGKGTTFHIALRIKP